METGDPAGAETEVRKAIVAGAPEDSTYPLLARALLAQGDFKKLTTELADRKLGTPAARAQMWHLARNRRGRPGRREAREEHRQ